MRKASLLALLLLTPAFATDKMTAPELTSLAAYNPSALLSEKAKPLFRVGVLSRDAVPPASR